MRNILKIVLLKLALSLAQISTNFQALNISCINSSYLVTFSNDSNLHVRLPTFFRATLVVDLRHIKSEDTLKGVELKVVINNTKIGKQYTQPIPLRLASKTFNLYAANDLILNSYFTITGDSSSDVTGKSYLFSKSVSCIITAANPQGTKQDSFLFIVKNTDLLSIPYNMIKETEVSSLNGYFISQANSMEGMQSRQTKIPSYSDFWNGLKSVALPYVPYLSNCLNQGDYMYFSQLIRNASYCQLYGDNAIPINEFSFGSTASADSCQFTTHCIYDQNINLSNEYPFWNTIDTTDSALFSITATQRTQNGILDTYEPTDLVPCKIKSTGGTNTSNMYPRKVSISFGYYQITSTQRRMITCEVHFSLYTNSSPNFKYQLDINIQPLSHTQVLLNFGFKWYIYMLVFIIIGLISNFQFIIFWCYHLIVTIKQRRNFNLKIYLKLVYRILSGVLPAAAISVLITFSVQIVMNGTFFGKAIFGPFQSFWNSLILDDIGYFSKKIEKQTQSGRMGFSYVIISSYLIILLSEYLIGKQRKRQQYEVYQILGRNFKPQEWNRGKFIFVTFAYMLFSIYFLYFTYTSVFAENIWFIIAFLQIFQMVCEEVVDTIFDDKLPCIPLKLTFGVLAYLATMGAIDLYMFILGYLIDVGISIIEITYLSQLQKSIKDYIQQKNAQLNKFLAKIFNDEQDEQENKSQAKETVFKNEQIFINQELIQINFLERQVQQDYNDMKVDEMQVYSKDEQIKQRFLEYMLQNDKNQYKDNKNKGGIFIKNEQYQREKEQLQNIKFELIIDGAVGMMQYLIQPIIVLILWITYDTSSILDNFQISNQNAILYLLSSIILALFFQINIIIIFHVLELYLNTDYEHQFRNMLEGFEKRSTFWIADLEQFDAKYEISLRGFHSYSLSPQLFFVVGFYTISVYLFINGAISIISAQFNIFKDPFIILIFIFWIVVLQMARWLLKQLATIFDIWGYSSLSSDRRSETQLEEPLSSFQQQTNEMLKKQELFNSSTIKFTFKKISQPVEKIEQSIQEERRKNLENKLATICKKLQPQFDEQDFRLAFARKNKDFIKQNMQKILPLVKSFPTDDATWIGKGNVIDDRDMKKQNKNCDPIISDFLTNWMKRVEANRNKRQEEGIQHERKLKRCKFCFQTWGLYYGYDGICLECSNNLFKQEQSKKDK